MIDRVAWAANTADNLSLIVEMANGMARYAHGIRSILRDLPSDPAMREMIRDKLGDAEEIATDAVAEINQIITRVI